MTSAQPERSILQKWYIGEFEEIAHSKQGDMHANGLKDILKEFPPALENVKQLCREFRGTLFPLRQSGGLDTGTHTPANELYAKVIEAYKETLSVLCVEKDS